MENVPFWYCILCHVDDYSFCSNIRCSCLYPVRSVVLHGLILTISCMIIYKYQLSDAICQVKKCTFVARLSLLVCTHCFLDCQKLYVPASQSIHISRCDSTSCSHVFGNIRKSMFETYIWLFKIYLNAFQALQINSSERKSVSIGQIISLMSVDSSRFIDMASGFHVICTIVPEVCWFLWKFFNGFMLSLCSYVSAYSWLRTTVLYCWKNLLDRCRHVYWIICNQLYDWKLG